MDTRKIAVACFIGGALCCAVALIFAPSYWWFGLVAGFAGGYISYEFREVRKAIPIAFLRAVGRKGVNAWKSTIAWAKVWFSQPHPFFYFGVFLALPLTFVFAQYIFSSEPITGPEMVIADIIGLTFVYCEMVTLLAFLSYFIALTGALTVERCCWVSAGDSVSVGVREDGYREIPLTYANAARWTMEGIFTAMKFFLWDLWRYLAIVTWKILRFFARFTWHLFRLIHSKERVLCAIDGTLGGAICYIWLAPASVSFVQQALLVIFGGLLGAAFGIANWEIVSKRILHVPVNGTA